MALIDELTTGPLAAEIAPFIESGDDGAILAILNRKDIASPGRITAHDIKQYFSLIGVRIPIMDSSAPSCREVTVALEDFPVFALTIPEVYAHFVAVLDALVAETLIPDFTETDKQTILYLASTQVSRAEQAGISVTAVDIRKELWNDDGSRRI